LVAAGVVLDQLVSAVLGFGGGEVDVPGSARPVGVPPGWAADRAETFGHPLQEPHEHVAVPFLKRLRAESGTGGGAQAGHDG